MKLTQREGIEKSLHRWRICNEYTSNTKKQAANMTRLLKWASLVAIATGAAITLFSAAASAADRHGNEEDRPMQVRKWSWAGSEWTRSRMQRDTTRGLDRDRKSIFQSSRRPTRSRIRSWQGRSSCCAQVIRHPDRTATGVEVPSGSPRGTITLPLSRAR